MLEIANLTHGEILNHNDGTETDDGLEINVFGIARPEERVTVNGVPAERLGDSFRAGLTLTHPVEDILVQATGNRGISTRGIQVRYDRNSFKRINFCIDDHIFFLNEIARTRPRSLFDHFYLRNLKAIHDAWGLRLTLNLFMEDVRDGFTLKDFPDSYQAEFQANSDWLRLAFHARREFPDRIYQNAEVGTLLGDLDDVEREIRRFAGEEALIAPANVHWSMVKTSALPELRRRGIRFLGGLFFEGQTRIGESASTQIACDGGFFESEENALIIRQRKIWHDFRYDITMGMENLVLNLEEMPILEKKLHALFSKPENEVLHMLTHEQYSFPFYANYLPDHFRRIERMAQMASEYGYRFVFFNEDFLGNKGEGK